MKTVPLARQYGFLSADERFRLAMHSLARGDHAELRRLHDSCPVKVYRTADQAYIERLEATRECVLRFTITGQALVSSILAFEQEINGEAERVGALAHGYVAGANTASDTSGSDAPFLLEDGRAPSRGELDATDWGRFELRRLFARHADLLDDHLDQIVNLRRLMRSFDKFARMVGLDVETLCAWYPPALDLREAATPYLALDMVEPDEEANLYEDLLAQPWRAAVTE